MELARQHNCSFHELAIQPAQWNVGNPKECRDFFSIAEKDAFKDVLWIRKPAGAFHGRGITIHKGSEGLRKKTNCDGKGNQAIVMRYINDTVLMGGHKFDMRTYLLIASTKPFLVFYHDGFIRRSQKKYTSASSLKDKNVHITNAGSQSSKNHFFSFEQLQDRLTAEHGFDPLFMDNAFRPWAKAVTNFLFHSAMLSPKVRLDRENGRFQLFALDWMVDQKGGVHLLEANGYPSTQKYPSNIGLTPGVFVSMLELVNTIHTRGGSMRVQDSFRHKRWHLVYNEAEVAAAKREYDPCRIREYVASADPLFSFKSKV